MSEADRKALKIKTGSVKRLAKELVLYGKEQDKESQRVADMKASGADAHDIKHAENVLAEATMIIPDTRQRLEAAYEELQAMLADANEVLLQSPEGVDAQQVLSEHAPTVEGS